MIISDNSHFKALSFPQNYYPCHDKSQVIDILLGNIDKTYIFLSSDLTSIGF